MEKDDNIIYYSIILACVVGIFVTAYSYLTTPPPKESFTELHFPFEKLDCNPNCKFHGFGVLLENYSVWIDLNQNGVKEEGEVFQKRDTLVLKGEYWNLSDLSENQVLFGKYPKEVYGEDFNFSFVVVNHLGEDHTYTYIVLIDDEEVFEGNVFVGDGEKKIVDVFLYVEKKGEVKVSVFLDTGEEIHFWLLIYQLSKPLLM